VAWGNARINRVNNNLKNSGELPYEIFEVREDILNGHDITRRFYGNEVIMNQDVHIARKNDMIVIRLQSEADDFESHLEDFE